MRPLWLLALPLPLLLTLACGSDSSSPAGTTCTPNQQIACPCPGGGQGVQVCDATGAAFSACTGCGQTTGGKGGSAGAGGGKLFGQGGAGTSTEGGQSGQDPQGGQGGDTTQGGEGGQSPQGGQGGDTTQGGEGGQSPQGGQGGDTTQGGEGGQSPQGGQGGQTPQGGQGGQNPQGGQSGAGGACASVVPLELRASQILVLLDRSGSMDEDGKWGSIRSALTTAFQQSPDTLNVGLLRFPEGTPAPCSNPNDLVCTSNFECTDIRDTPNVPIGPLVQVRPQLQALLQETQPGGGTPTRWALKKAWAMQKTSAAAADKFVLLLTDGIPTYVTPAFPPILPTESSVDCGTEAQLAQETSQSFKQPPLVRTLVIGVPGSEEAQSTLSGIAQNGGGCRPGGSPQSLSCHYQIGSSGFEQELTTTARQILASLSCRYQLASPLAGSGQLVITVGPNQTTVPEGGADGWSYTDALQQTVQLSGAACSLTHDNPGAVVQFKLGCP